MYLHNVIEPKRDTIANGGIRRGTRLGIHLTQRLITGEDVLLAEAEKYHDLIFLWVYTLVRPQEGKT